MKKKLKGTIVVQTAAVIVAMIVMFIGGGALGASFINNLKADMLKQQCDVIDKALFDYGLEHMEYVEGSANYNSTTGKFTYERDKVYPATLEELDEIREYQGYFSLGIDLSNFEYKLTKNAEGKNSYILTAKLPKGETFTSARSGK